MNYLSKKPLTQRIKMQRVDTNRYIILEDGKQFCGRYGCFFTRTTAMEIVSSKRRLMKKRNAKKRSYMTLRSGTSMRYSKYKYRK